MLLLFLSVSLFVRAFGVDTHSIFDTSEENRRPSGRGLRIVDDEEFSKYRQEPLTIPPPLSHISNDGNMNVNMGLEMKEEPRLHRYQHHRQGHGRGRSHRQGLHHHVIGAEPQHFDAELNNDVSSFRHSDNTFSDVDHVPVKSRKFRPHFPIDEPKAHGVNIIVHPHHKHHPIRASFDEFDGHTGEYVRSGHVTSVPAVLNGLPN